MSERIGAVEHRRSHRAHSPKHVATGEQIAHERFSAGDQSIREDEPRTRLESTVSQERRELRGALRAHGETITKTFYGAMFAAHPELYNLFNPANQRDGGQARSLAAAVLAYAEHIDALDRLGADAERTAHPQGREQPDDEQRDGRGGRAPAPPTRRRHSGDPSRAGW